MKIRHEKSMRFPTTNLLTMQEVAARLRVSRATAARLIAAGTIHGICVVTGPRRRLIRVPEEALAQYVDRLDNAEAADVIEPLR